MYFLNTSGDISYTYGINLGKSHIYDLKLGQRLRVLPFYVGLPASVDEFSRSR